MTHNTTRQPFLGLSPCTPDNSQILFHGVAHPQFLQREAADSSSFQLSVFRSFSTANQSFVVGVLTR